MSKAGESRIRNERGEKFCRQCATWKPPELFRRNSRFLDMLHTACKKCDASAIMKRRYGITVAEFEVMLAEQGGRCKICNGGLEKWALDHDHACCQGKRTCGKCIRGVLCSNCNVGLGMFQDNPATLKKAIDYLEA